MDMGSSDMGGGSGMDMGSGGMGSGDMGGMNMGDMGGCTTSMLWNWVSLTNDYHTQLTKTPKNIKNTCPVSKQWHITSDGKSILIPSFQFI